MSHQWAGYSHSEGGDGFPAGSEGAGEDHHCIHHIFSLVEKICDRVGIIINGQMTVCENLQTLCGEKSLEDRFFEIYEAVSGEETDHDK